MARDNVHKKVGEDQPCGYQAMQAYIQTYSLQYCAPSWGEIIVCSV